RRGTRLPGPARHTIGSWPWELDVFPDDLAEPFAGFDEVWALSRFSPEAIARAAPVPVHTGWPDLPAVERPGGAPRAPVVALERGVYNFLFIYDLLSETDR